MFIRIIIVLFLFIPLAQAEELSVSFGLMKFRLGLEAKKAELSGKNLSLSLDRSKCNAEIFDQFKKNIEFKLKTMKVHVNASPEKVEVVYGKKKSYFLKNSPEGKFFLSLPDQFKKNKIQSRLKCAS